MTTCTNSESTDQQHLRVKFLGDKKGPTIGFYLEVWKISSVFLYQVYLLNYQLCTVHIIICEGLYLRVSHVTAWIKKRLKYYLE